MWQILAWLQEQSLPFQDLDGFIRLMGTFLELGMAWICYEVYVKGKPPFKSHPVAIFMISSFIIVAVILASWGWKYCMIALFHIAIVVYVSGGALLKEQKQQQEEWRKARDRE